MNSTDLEAYRQSLLALRSRLTNDVEHLTQEALREAGGAASGGMSNTPLHMADLGSDTYEQEMAFGLLENQQQTIEEVDAALARLHQGRYGICEACGGAVPRARLQALPYARTCVDCARKREKGG